MKLSKIVIYALLATLFFRGALAQAVTSTSYTTTHPPPISTTTITSEVEIIPTTNGFGQSITLTETTRLNPLQSPSSLTPQYVSHSNTFKVTTDISPLGQIRLPVPPPQKAQLLRSLHRPIRLQQVLRAPQALLLRRQLVHQTPRLQLAQALQITAPPPKPHALTCADLLSVVQYFSSASASVCLLHGGISASGSVMSPKRMLSGGFILSTTFDVSSRELIVIPLDALSEDLHQRMLGQRSLTRFRSISHPRTRHRALANGHLLSVIP
jgi:hypothetical protein